MTTTAPTPSASSPRVGGDRATDGGSDPADRIWRVLAVAGVIATAVLYRYIAQTAVAPHMPFDENHLLQMARVLAGDDDVAQLAGSGYYPGWAVVLAPVWWFTQDPATVYRAAVELSNVIGLGTIVPLALLGRRLGLTGPQGVALASVVMLLPARSVMADFALSEQLIMFLVAWVVLAAFAVWQRPTAARVVALVALVGAAYLTHPRTIAVVGTTAIWLLALVLRRWRVALLGLVLLSGTWFAVERASRALAERVLLEGFGKPETLARTLERFDPGLFGTVVLTQGWVQVVGTAGLVAVGAVEVAARTVGELRSRRLGTGAFLLGLLVSTVLVSALWWNRPEILLDEASPRLDAWTYSRYVDPVSGVVVMVALAALVRGAHGRVVALASAATAAVAVPVVLLVAPQVPLWGTLSPSNAAILSWAGMFPVDSFARPLLPTFTNDARFWLWASVFALACLAAIALLRRRPRTLAGGALALACVLALLANPSLERPYPARVTAAVEQLEDVALDGRLADVELDVACRTGGTFRQPINWFPLWLSPRTVELVDPGAGETFDADLVLACEDWAEADRLGARAYDAEPDYGYRVWVLPGSLQDELDAAGLLR